MKMTTLGLVWGKLSLISMADFWRTSASALKLVEYFSSGYGDVCLLIIMPDVHPTSPFSGGFFYSYSFVGIGPLIFWVPGVDILLRQ